MQSRRLKTLIVLIWVLAAVSSVLITVAGAVVFDVLGFLIGAGVALIILLFAFISSTLLRMRSQDTASNDITPIVKGALRNVHTSADVIAKP